MISATFFPVRILLLGLLLPAFSAAAEKTGPAIGQPLPSFEAPDQNGSKQTLDSIMGPKGALVVFYRSADW